MNEVLEAWCTNVVMLKREHASYRQCLYLEPMTYPFNFGDDPDYDSDLGPVLRWLISEELCSIWLTDSQSGFRFWDLGQTRDTRQASVLNVHLV